MKANRALRQFLKEYLANPKIKPPENCLRQSWYGSSFIIFRSGQFQVEVVTANPHTIIPPHIHPNVDTYERFMIQSGGMAWEGDRQMSSKQLAQTPERYSGFIPAGTRHGAYTGNGAVFFSFQHWLNDVPPGFVADDWVSA